jgi:hypothetical protein
LRAGIVGNADDSVNCFARQRLNLTRKLMQLTLKIKLEKKQAIIKELHMEAGKYQKIGLIICIIIFLLSCNSNEKYFYDKVKTNANCMIALNIIYNNNNNNICIVMEKWKITNLFEEHNVFIDDNHIINSIKNNRLIKVPESLFKELYAQQIINQHRVDSLINKSTVSIFLINHNNEKSLNINVLDNSTLMEELYIIKKLFDKKILLEQDCESGYYYVIN